MKPTIAHKAQSPSQKNTLIRALRAGALMIGLSTSSPIYAYESGEAFDVFVGETPTVRLPEKSLPGAQSTSDQVNVATAGASASAATSATVRVDPASFPSAPGKEVSTDIASVQDSSVFLATGWTGPDARLRAAEEFHEVCVQWLDRRADKPGREVLDLYPKFVLAQAADDSLHLTAALDALVNWRGLSGHVRDGLLNSLAPLIETTKAQALNTFQLAHILYLEGMLNAVAGQPDEAIAKHKAALRLAPAHPLNGRALFGLYGMRGDTDSQARVGRVLLDVGVGDALMLWEVAKALDRAGSTSEALKLCDAFPSLVTMTPGLAIYRVQLMKMSGASANQLLEAFEPAYEANKADPGVAIFRLVLLDAAERTDEVAAQIEETIHVVDLARLPDDPVESNYAATLIALAERLGVPEKANPLISRMKAPVATP